MAGSGPLGPLSLFAELASNVYDAQDVGRILLAQNTQQSQNTLVSSLTVGCSNLAGGLTASLVLATKASPVLSFAMGLAMSAAMEKSCNQIAQDTVNGWQKMVNDATSLIRQFGSTTEQQQQFNQLADAAQSGDVATTKSLASAIASESGFSTTPDGNFLQQDLSVPGAPGFDAITWNDDWRLSGTVATDGSGNTIKSQYDPSNGNQTSQETDYATGGKAQTTFSNDPNSLASSTTTLVDANGNVLGTITSYRDGSADFVRTDGTGKQILVHQNPDGSFNAPVVDQGFSYPIFVQAIADTLATQLITKYLTGNDIPATIALQAFADATINSALHPGSDFSSSFASSAVSIAGGIAGSDLGGLIADKLGLPTELGSIPSGVAGNLVAQGILKEAMNNFQLPEGQSFLDPDQLAVGIEAAGGAAVGSLLANALIPTNEAGQIVGSLATAVAVAELTTTAAGGLASASEIVAAVELTQPELAPLVVFTVAFGSNFLGTIIGDILGGLFGNNHPSVGPNANSLNQWDPTSQTFKVVALGEDNGGSTVGVKAMGDALDSVMGSMLAAMGGTVVGTPEQMSLMWFENKYYYALGNHYPQPYPDVFNTPNAAVEAAAIKWMSTLTISGADPYMAFMAKHSTATSLTGFYSDLNAAKAYSNYISDPVDFDLALAAANDPAVYTNWQNQLLRIQALGLDQLSTGELAALHQYGYVTPDGLNQLGTVMGSGQNFFGDGSSTYFVKSGSDISAWQYNAAEGFMTNKVALKNSNGTSFDPGTGAKIVGTSNNLAGSGDYDMVAQDSSGHLMLYKLNHTGVVTDGTQLTYADGTPVSLGQQAAIPDYGSDAYWSMWQSTFRSLGYTGAFDGHSPAAWYQTQYGSALDTTTAAGMQQLLTHLHGVPQTPSNGQLLAVQKNILGSGGVDLVTQDTAGHVYIHEFNAQGKATNELTLNYPNGSPVFDVNQPIPDYGTDAYWTMWQQELRAVGFTGNFDGVSGHAWFNDTFGIELDGTSAAGMRQLLAKVEELSPHLVGAASNLTGSGVVNLIYENASGHLSLDTFSSAGALLSQQTIENADGSARTYAAGVALIGTSNNLLGSGGYDLVFQDAAGNLTVEEFNSAGKLIPNGSQPLTLGQGFTALSNGAEDPAIIASNQTVGVTSGNSPATVIGNNDTITVADNLQPALLGSNDTINLGAHDGVTVYKGHGNTVNGSGATIQTGSDVGLTVNGSADAITSADGASIAVGGNGPYGDADTVALSHGQVTVADWSHASVTGANDTVQAGSYDNLTVTGNSNAVTAGDTSAVTVSGDNGTVHTGSSGWLSLNSGSGNTLTTGSGETVGLTNADHTSVTAGQSTGVADTGGSQNTMSFGNWGMAWLTNVSSDVLNMSGGWVYAYDHVTARINGSGNVIAANTGDDITIGGNGQWDTAETLSGSTISLHLENSSSVALTGSNDTVNGGTSDGMVVTGDNNAITLGNGGFIWEKSGNGDVLHVSSATIELDGGTHNTSVSGNNNIVYGNTGASLNISGSGNGIAASGVTIYLNSDATNTVIQGNNDIVHVSAGATYQISGSGETIVTDHTVNVQNGSTLATYNGLSDLLDLVSVPFDSSITATPVPNGSGGGQIVVADHGSTVATINVTSASNVGSFTARSDGHGGTLIVDPPLNNALGGSSSNDQFAFRSGEFGQNAGHATQGVAGQVAMTEHGFDFSGVGGRLHELFTELHRDAQAFAPLAEAVLAAASEATQQDDALLLHHPMHQAAPLSHWELHA